jgi:FkbM family methyltransferase
VSDEAWLQALPWLLHELKVPPAGIIHLGAHDGREVPSYRQLGFGKIILVEPHPVWAAALRQAHPDLAVIEAAVGRYAGTPLLHITDPPEASSLLTPYDLQVTEEVEVVGAQLDELPLAGINVLVADIQGSEYEALDSDALDTLDLIIVETTTTTRYVGEADRAEVHDMLLGRGWMRVGQYPHRQNPAISDEAYYRS